MTKLDPQAAEEAWRVSSLLFLSDDPCAQSLADGASVRALGWYFDYGLSEVQLSALQRVVGTPMVVACELEGERNCWQGLLHERLSYSLLRSGMANGVESVLFAADGSWGIMVSAEGHALFAGDGAIAEAIVAGMTEFRQGTVMTMLRAWRDQTDVADPTQFGWIVALVEHVYGEAGGRKLLEDARFPGDVLGDGRSWERPR